MRGTGGTADVASAMLDMLEIDRNLYKDIFSVEELEAELVRWRAEWAPQVREGFISFRP